MEVNIKGEVYNLKKETFDSRVVYNLYSQDGRGVGFVYYRINKESDNSIFLINIDIATYCQSRGLGQFLFDLLYNDAILEKVYFIEGKYAPTNNYARPFYIKNGCEIYKDCYESYVRKDIPINAKENDFYTHIHIATSEEEQRENEAEESASALDNAKKCSIAKSKDNAREQ